MKPDKGQRHKWQIFVVIFASLVLISDVTLWVWGKQEIANIAGEVSAESKIIIESFRKEIKQGVKESINGVTKQLSLASHEIIEESLSVYKNELEILNRDSEKERADLERLRKDKARALNNLPELVELNDLRNYYGEKLKNKNNYSYKTLETFDTSQGRISFTVADFEFELVPSTNDLAWIRIGKNNSTLNSQLINAWIKDSRAIKKKLGYKLVYKHTKPSDYGEYTESLLEKGDMYFKTYYQHQRVSGTYGRHSLQYTFYVETGSKSRKEQAKLERFNKSLGS